MHLRTFTALVCLAGAAAQAQTRTAASLDLMSGTASGTNGPWQLHADSRFAARVERANGFAFLEGQLLQRDGFAAQGMIRAEGAWETRPFGPFRASLTASASNTSTFASKVSVAARFGHGGLWLGGGRSDGGDLTANMGVWRAFGKALVALTFEPERLAATRQAIRERQVQGIDTVWSDTSGWQHLPFTRTRVDTTDESVLRSRPGLALRGNWASGRWTVSATAARRIHNDSFPAATAEMTIVAALTRGVGVVASGRAASTHGVSATEPLRSLSVGVRLWSAARPRPLPAPVRPVATSFVFAHLGGSAYRVTLNVPGARTVEVSGDFNRWTPVTLRETSPNTWEVSVAMTPGTHRINVRVNGDTWTAPPGLPAVDDEFAGRVGIIVVR